jgi:hypothetical protein
MVQARWCERWCELSLYESARQGRAGQDRAGQDKARQGRAAGQGRRAGPLRSSTRTRTVANVQLDGIN